MSKRKRKRIPIHHRDLLTFVLVGAGPMGVEMASAIAMLVRNILPSEFRRIDPVSARIVLVDMAPRVLGSFDEELSAAAKKRLEDLGVKVRLGQGVDRIDEEGVLVGGERIASRTVVWTAGVAPSPTGKWLGVEITVDPESGKIYWTQKGPTKAGSGLIFRANMKIPKGETPANRSDIEVLSDKLPEPIDLELDLENRILYWTDRGDPPRGNTVNRASMDAKSVEATPKILVTHLMEGIEIALDFKGNRMFFTDLADDLYSARLDGSEKKLLLGA